jgi:hypothetical protein
MPLISTQYIVTVEGSQNSGTDAIGRLLVEALENYPPVRVVSLTMSTYFYGGNRDKLVAVVEEV